MNSVNIFTRIYSLFFIFYTGFTDSWFSGLVPSISLALALVLLILPININLFAGFLASFSAQILIMMPDIPNVIFFSLVINLTILSHFIICLLNHKPVTFHNLRYIILLELSILYLFAFFHKLNYSFLDPECSCGTYLTSEILENLPSFKAPSSLFYFIIYLTLIIELTLPLTLLWGRTRKWALIFGLLFHFMLARSHYDFSALIFAIYSLFLPVSIFKLMKYEYLKLIAVIVLLISIIISWVYPYMYSYRIFMILWYAFATMFLLNIFLQRHVLFTALIKSDSAYSQPFYHYVFPLIMIFNGLNPYLGLKTEYSFAMYSNLRTELGKSNHILMSNSFAIFNFQKDVVYLIDSNIPGLNTPSIITYFEFIKLVEQYEGHKNYYLKYKYDDKISLYKFENSMKIRQYPFYGLLKKYLKFRPIQDTKKVKCVH